VPRPPRYKSEPSLLPRILGAIARGAPLADAARLGPVALETLLRWQADDPDVARQIEGAQEAGREKVGGPRANSEPSGATHSGATSGDAGALGREQRSTSGDRWARVHDEAARLGPGLYGYLLWLEARIGAHNAKAPPWDHMPPMPAPLLAIFRDFWASGKQELLIRAGRGFGKSTIFCRPILIECTFGPRVVNGGETAICPELSVDMDEANLKVRVFASLFKIAGLREEDGPRKDDDPDTFKILKQERGRSRIVYVSAEHERMEIRVYPATVAALSGPTLKCARHDEEAKWKASSKEGTNSAEEVIDAEAGAFRGRPHAHLYRVSSAWMRRGPHFDDVEAGDTPSRMVARIGADFLDLARAGFEARAEVSSPADASEIRAYAASLTADSPNLPSWFNPSLDPRTLKARNVRVFLREYGSLSTGADGDGDYFDTLILDAAEQRQRPAGEPSAVFAAIDTGAKKNPAALAIVGRWEVREGPPLAPTLLRSWRPSPGHPLDLRLDVLPAMARATLAAGCTEWVSDGFASDQIDIVAAEYGIRVTYVATSEAHRDVYAPVSDGLARGEVSLTGCDGIAEAVAQMRRVSSETELGAAGARVRIVVPEDAGGEHGDLGVALVRALAAAGCGRIEEDGGGELLGAEGRYVGIRAA